MRLAALTTSNEKRGHRPVTVHWAIALFALALFAHAGAHATDFTSFDRLDIQGQAEYVTAMVDASQQALRAEKRTDLADRLVQTFMEIKPGDQISDGQAELQILIAKARLADAKRLAKDPKARPLDVEDALFVWLKRSDMPPTDAHITSVLDAMAKFHPRTNGEFLALPPAEQRRVMRWYSVLGFRYWALLEEEHAQKETFFKKDGAMNAADILQTQFPAVGDQPGFARVVQRIAGKPPGQPGPLNALIVYMYDEVLARIHSQQAALKVREKELDATAVMLPDGRLAYLEKDGGYSVFIRDVRTRLQGADLQLAQRLGDCKERRHIANGEQALAACQAEVGIAPTAAPRTSPR